MQSPPLEDLGGLNPKFQILSELREIKFKPKFLDMENSKVDFKKELKQFYNPKPIPQIVEIPSMQYLMIDGSGAIEGKEFKTAIETLFSISFKAKFISKETLKFDYAVMPLEGLWWADDMNDFISNKKENWKWTLMIMQPDIITNEIINSAIQVIRKKKLELSDNVKLQPYTEGKSVQMMHIGPFSEEHANIMKMHKLIEENEGKFDGKINKHHEIYLSDFRKVDPMKMKTILRQPFVKQ